jgi:hypothetical protein
MKDDTSERATRDDTDDEPERGEERENRCRIARLD